MKVVFSNDAPATADVNAFDIARDAVTLEKDVVTSNILVIHCIRAVLFLLPIDKRPTVEWTVNGREVHFDELLRSEDLWKDPATEILDKAIEILLGPTGHIA